MMFIIHPVRFRSFTFSRFPTLDSFSLLTVSHFTTSQFTTSHIQNITLPSFCAYSLSHSVRFYTFTQYNILIPLTVLYILHLFASLHLLTRFITIQGVSMTGENKGKLYIIGIGPGSVEQLTVKARDVILNAEYIVGNDTYLDQIEDLLTTQNIYRSSMGKEVDRAREAVRLAQDHVTAMVSGGDANVYGMAGIVIEVAEKSGLDVEIEVLPGVTAMLAGASVLGAPVVTDAATVSLSDLLTPWEVIEKRLACAAQAGFIIALYNPKSRQRKSNFEKAIEIIRANKSGNPADIPVGLVKNALRGESQEYVVTTLEKVLDYNDWVDMSTAIIICNEESRIWNSPFGDRIITPRGYQKKYEY